MDVTGAEMWVYVAITLGIIALFSIMNDRGE